MLKTKYARLFEWMCYAITVAIFIIDLFTPLGIADGVLYTIVIMITIWIGGERSTLFAALATSVLTLLGMALSPAGEGIAIYVTNRVFALISIWAATYVIIRFKEAEFAATRNRDSLRALFEFATEGIIISDDKGEIIMANPEVEKQFGYDKGELLGKRVEILVPHRATSTHAKNRDAYYKHPHQRYKGIGMELAGKRKDNSEFPVEISLSNYSLGGQMFVISFIIDITRRKEQQDAIKKAHDDLKQSALELKRTNAELENFAYVSSHDLQEPLRKIQSFGDRIKTREASKLSPEGQDYLDRMLNASARMQRLINDLLTFSRLTSQAQAFTQVDLDQVLTEVLSDLEVSIEKSAAIIHKEKLPVIEAEPTQMRQLFQNLIGNALKFRKENEVPHIRIYSQQPDATAYGWEMDQYVQLYFEDNGIGFDEKYHDKIFSIFQRLDGRKYEGSGIGLAICKKIVGRHSGDIMAKSMPGKGTTFIVTLPLQQIRKQEKTPETETTITQTT